jgi:hypothetical protein
VGVEVALAVAVVVGVAVAVGVGVPLKWHQTASAVSTRQPSLEVLLSLAILQRSTAFKSSPGRFTVVVMKPPELPLHARRPAIGLPRSELIVRLYPPVSKLPETVMS